MCEPTLIPRDTNYLVQLLDPETKSAGGIFLPETVQENWEDAIIRRAGPGFFMTTYDGHPPFNAGFDAGMQCFVDERIVFERHAYRPLFTGSRWGVVADEAVICIIAGEAIYPANDWVLIEPEDFVPAAGAVLLPEACQSRENHGIVRRWGSGMLQRRGPLSGQRKRVLDTLNVGAWDLMYRRVWWGGAEEAFEVGSDRVSGVLVRAENLLFIEE